MPSNLVPRGHKTGARVEIGGVVHWLGTFDTPELAQRAVDRARGGWRPDVTTVAEWAEQVWELYPGRRTAETTAHYVEMCAPFVRVCGKRALVDIDVPLAQGWANRHPGHVVYLRRMFGKAVKAGLLDSNPWAAVEVSRSAPARRPPTADELARIVRACHRRGGWWVDFASLILVAAFTGARLSGLAGLEDTDVSLLSRRMLVLEKGSKSRWMSLLGPALDVMAAHVSQREGLLFRSPQGQRLDRKIVSSRWRIVADEAGFADSFHSLKHFAATWLRDMGADRADIAVQLGHTDPMGRPYPDLIDRTYAHPTSGLALDRLEALASGQSLSLGERVQEGSPDERQGIAGGARAARAR